MRSSAASLGRALLPLAIAVSAWSCITDPQLKAGQQTQPAETADGWTVSSLAAEGMGEAAVDAALDIFYSDTAYYNALSLLVVRNGKLVVEAFTRGAGEREVGRNIQSVTKSVTSLVFGITRDRGFFPNLDATLYSIIPGEFDDDPRKRAITLDQLLTMRSGILFDNDNFSVELLMDRPRNQARYILSKPLYAEPGDSFYYRDADPQLLSSAVQAASGATLDQLAREYLFGPLGITHSYWEANVDGTSLGAHALFLRARDMAKIGQLVLQRGMWEGKQLVSESWIELSTSAHTLTGRSGLEYGYYWWVVPELAAFTAWGHGGNCIFIVPDESLVIVLTSLPSSDDDEVGTTLERFLPLVRQILAATNS